MSKVDEIRSLIEELERLQAEVGNPQTPARLNANSARQAEIKARLTRARPSGRLRW